LKNKYCHPDCKENCYDRKKNRICTWEGNCEQQAIKVKTKKEKWKFEKINKFFNLVSLVSEDLAL